MKKLLFLLFLTSLTMTSSAQLSLRIYNYRPTGDLGAVFKPTISAEFGYTDFFDDDWVRPVVRGTVVSLKPRMKELPVTGEIEDSQGIKVYPGTMSYKFFINIQLHGGFDFAVYKNKKFHAFIGTSLLVGEAFIRYHEVIPGFSEEEGFINGTQIGFQVRAGLEYQLNDHLNIFTNANRNFYYMYSDDISGLYWANDYGLGISYDF